VKVLAILFIGLLSACRATGVQGLDPLSPTQLGVDVFPDIDTLHPTFEWKPFPGDEDEALFGAGLARVRNARYDLIVLRATADLEKVYERLGLEETEHRIEIDLEPDTAYYWSVRTRFTIDGKTRVTPWSTLGPLGALNARRTATVPNPFLFRFETPRLGNVRN